MWRMGGGGREHKLHGNFGLQDISVGRTLAGFPETQYLQNIVS